VGTRLAAFENTGVPAASPDPGPSELAERPDPAAPARELLTQLQSALGQLGKAAAEQQAKRAESGSQPGGCARLILFLLLVGLGFLMGSWLAGK
jgi:hypothetical protein